jgi:hypothetical protein
MMPKSAVMSTSFCMICPIIKPISSVSAIINTAPITLLSASPEPSAIIGTDMNILDISSSMPYMIVPPSALLTTAGENSLFS